MADVEERPGRQLATNLRELMKQVDIRTGTDRDTNVNKDRDNESVASASVRDIFARARTNIPTPASRITRPRGLSIDSEMLSTDDGDDASTVDSTPIARVPPGAATLNALRQRLDNVSDAPSDLTGWDRSARSLLTTRGQASQSRLNIYDDESNLLDEDLGQVPALTVSHVDFAPSVGSTSHTASIGATPRQRPPAIPRGPSLQSASIADRLAGIPDDGLEFDDTDREDFDRNRMDDDSDDLLHQDNDLLRSTSPPPPESPSKPQPRPISGSWENVMAEGSVMSLPNVDGRKPARKQELGSSGGSGGSGSGSKLLQAIQDEEDSYQRSIQDKSGSTVVGDETQRPSTSPDKTDRPTNRLSLSGRSRLPMAKPSTSKPATPKDSPASGSKLTQAQQGHRPTGSDIAFPSSPQDPNRPVNRLGEPSRIPRPSSPGPSVRSSSRIDAPQSPASPRTSIIAPVTPSRIPRVSMSHSPHSSIDGSPSMGRSVSAFTPSRTRATSALGAHPPVTTPSRTRATSATVNGTPPENDVDRERGWGKQLPKLTHANLRMRYDQMDTVNSHLSGPSPERKGVAVHSRPTTPSFVGYSRKGTSEVSSSNGSAGSDEDTNLRRSRKLSIASGQGVKSGRELRGSPSAPSVTRSPSLKRTSSLKTPSKTAATMRHSLSFTGSPSAAGSSERGGASPIHSPRKPGNRHSTGFVSPKDYQSLRERDWGRPANSRAVGLANVLTRGGTPGARKRVVSGGSVAGSDVGATSPVARDRTGVARPRPHTVHLGGSYTTGAGQSLQKLEREPLGREFEDDEMSESVLEWQRRQQSIEELQEETEVEEMEVTRPESPSPPSPSRSIPLPDSPPPLFRQLSRGTTPPPQPPRSHSVPTLQLHPPQDPSVSLFDGMVGESTTRESSRGRRDSLRRDAREKEQETTVRQERDEPQSDSEHPDSPKHLTFAQPESPTISFMDTLPPLPEPPSDDEQSMAVPPVRPSVNTRLNRIAREPSPGSGSASEKTPRASTMSLRVPSPGVPTPPETDIPRETTSLLGLEPTPAQTNQLEVPRPVRTRSRSNTLGVTLPRVDVNTSVPRDEIDSAATPIATRWNPPVREEKKPAEVKAPRKPSPLASQGSSPAVTGSVSLPPTSSPPPPLQSRHSDPQLPPMMSQKGKEILQRMQQQAASLARDLEVESKQPVPQGGETKAETEQIVQISATARAERERLEKLRQVRGPKENVKVVEASGTRSTTLNLLDIVFHSSLVALRLAFSLLQCPLPPCYKRVFGPPLSRSLWRY
ncbi:unnamed protein product [Rhizoctonia solani]|uniref:Uncharacterized protein n=1 Tax=Rhizoctonia solani TaxID=456999 RepID=A0A8H3E2E1_9AGAM|nr:unnamed protein product [Rhizoctonia solani]